MTHTATGATLALPTIQTTSLPSASTSTSLQPNSTRGSLSNLSSLSSSPRPSSPSTLATSPYHENDHSDNERERETSNLGSQDVNSTTKTLRQRSSFFGLIRPRPSNNALAATWDTHAGEQESRLSHDQRKRSTSPTGSPVQPQDQHRANGLRTMTASSSDPHLSASSLRVPVRMSSRELRTPGQESDHELYGGESEGEGADTSDNASGIQASAESLAEPAQVINTSSLRNPSTSGQVSVREIRRAATSKLPTSETAPPHRLPALVPPHHPSSASSSQSGSRRPSKGSMGNLSPRSPIMSRTAGDSDNERRDEEPSDGEEGSPARSRGVNRRLTMVDFLAADRPGFSESSPVSSTSATPAIPLTASRSATFASLRSSPIQTNQRPQSLLVEPSSSSQEPVEMPSATTNASSASSIASYRLGDGVAALSNPLRLNTKIASDKPPVQPSRPSAAPEKQVIVTVKPMTDIMTMFGSTQTSANYSLSGSVEVSLPRSRRKQTVPAGMTRRLSYDGTSATVRQEDGAEASSSTGEQRRADLLGSSPCDVEDSMTVKELTVHFNGYSTYADHTGRYSGIRLCEIKQDLLPAEACLSLSADLQSRTRDDGSSHEAALKYEIQFDLSIPGWLPGSAFSRFGSTFFCLSASAIVEDSSGEVMVMRDSTRDSSTSSLRTPNSAPDLDEGSNSFTYAGIPSPSAPNSSADVRGARNAPNSAVSPRVGFNDPMRRASETSKVQTHSAQKQKSKPKWLAQTAKAISFKARPNPLNEDAGGSSSNVGGTDRGGSACPAVTRITIPRTDQAGTKRLANGNLEVKSKKQLIIVRRCRDVVPVPVARMAILGDNVSLAAQHLPPQMSSQTGSTIRTLVTDATVPQTRLEESLRPDNVNPAAAMTHSQSASSSIAHPVGLNANNAALMEYAQPAALPFASPAVAGAASDASVTPPVPAAARPTSLPAAPAPSPVPSASSVPATLFDPAKIPSIAPPPAPTRTSSAMDGQEQAVPRTTTSSSTDGGVPMRHFLHRPILHPPVDSGIQEGLGLPFSLTISVPSHIQVQAAEILSFGVQVEVGRSAAWSKVRELGGLRLRDMELVCLQTERHTSVPSRTFCSTFPVPAEAKILASDLPIFPDFSPPVNNRRVTSSQEARVRLGYDPEPIRNYLSMAEAGRQVPVENNDVERVRAGVVGPPPGFKHDKQGDRRSAGGQSTASKGKDRAVGGDQQQRRKSNGRPVEMFSGRTGGSSRRASASATATADPTSHRQSLNSASATPALSLGNNFRRSASSSLTPATGPSVPALYSVPTASPISMRGQPASADPSADSSSAGFANAISPTSEEAGSSSNNGPDSASPGGRRGGRGRRAYEATIRGLSAFATAVLDAGFEEAGPSTPYSPFAGNNASFVTGEQPRASYSFRGDDGHGVDLTKGRVRMTVNLPMVTSSATLARREATPQLLPDYESPHMRIRHKLKVKLGFGFGPKPLAGDGEWGQSLVMCVPVRFTEAPPKEVSDQFAPMPITVASAGEANAGVIQPIIMVADPNSAPVLPAYTQLFRDDGSRLNEAEDLPAYPGPRRGGSIANGGSSGGSGAIRPALSSRGSVTGPPRSIRFNHTQGESSAVPDGGLGVRRPSISTRHSATGRGSTAAANAVASRGVEGLASDGDEDLGLPMDNSLAPEQVVDEALRSITDPDETRAEIREQEREMAELEDERDLMISAALRGGGVGDGGDGEDDGGGGSRLITSASRMMTIGSTAGSSESPVEGEETGGEDAMMEYASPQEDEEEDVDAIGDETQEVDQIIGEGLDSGMSVESPSAYEIRTRLGREMGG